MPTNEELTGLRNIILALKAKKESANNMSEPIRKTIVDVVSVERHGSKVILPENVPMNRIIAALQKKMEEDETIVAVNGSVDGFINEGCHAFYQVLKEKFGLATAVATPGFFGPTPPMMRTVSIGVGEYIQIPWGRFELPGVEGFVSTGYDITDGRVVFQVRAEVKRKDEHIIKQIIEDTRKYMKEFPLYGKKAFSIRLRDDSHEIEVDPQPKFIPLNPNILNELVFSEDVRVAINTSIFTPIRHTARVRAVRGSLKRGVLLSGRFGTGKSMTSAATAFLAIENGWTFIICERADELADVLRLAKDYGPAVVFCEDIDRVMNGQRSVDMDEILNVIDGVESKDVELMVVLTTNYVENINQAMLRPGRLDAVINVTAPDAAAVERLIRQYARGLVADDLNISDIGETMSGNIPAVIREMVERAKLAAIDSTPADIPLNISHDALVAASLSMGNQLELLRERTEDKRSSDEKAADILATPIARLADAIAGPTSIN